MIEPMTVEAATAAALARVPLSADGCLVAVSGGPDSCALLHAVAKQFASDGSFAPLVVAHVNHQLRGAESDGDEEYVRALSVSLQSTNTLRDVQFISTRLDVRQEVNRRKSNLEATARSLRYRWLGEQARTLGMRWVLTAHNLNDQAETTLFHILRGTGLRGLCGMRPRRRLTEGVSLFRPWLNVPRTEILAYLEKHKLASRLDSSNLDTQFTRNRLRRDLLPKLEAEFNPRIIASLAALSEHAAHACRLLDRELKRILIRAELPRAGKLLIFRANVLIGQSTDVLQSLFAFLWKRENWPSSRMGRREWSRLANWIASPKTMLELPEGIRAVKKRTVVQLGPHK
jgi:tRNA(Ile)-lysidine synthase